MKIVVLDNYCLNPGDVDQSLISELGVVEYYDRTDVADIVSRCIDAEVIITNKVALSEATLKQLPKLKMIAVAATGYNIVDIEAAKSQKIIVCNSPGYAMNSVAQHVFAMILDIVTRMSKNVASVKAGEWSKSKDFSFSKGTITELAGKTIGIVGFGAIGRKVAEIADAFGMRPIFITKSMTRRSKHAERVLTLDYLLPVCDFLTLHCSLNSETKEIINSATLAQMKKTAWLINTSRGGLVNEADLAKALNDGTIAGAALDVLTIEPPNADNPLLSAKNCIISPHTAWASREARQMLTKIIADNIKNIFVYERPQNVVS